MRSEVQRKLKIDAEYPTKNLNRDVSPFGNDIEPVSESRADVKIGHEEHEEPSDTVFPESE